MPFPIFKQGNKVFCKDLPASYYYPFQFQDSKFRIISDNGFTDFWKEFKIISNSQKRTPPFTIVIFDNPYINHYSQTPCVLSKFSNEWFYGCYKEYFGTEVNKRFLIFHFVSSTDIEIFFFDELPVKKEEYWFAGKFIHMEYDELTG